MRHAFLRNTWFVLALALIIGTSTAYGRGPGGRGGHAGGGRAAGGPGGNGPDLNLGNLQKKDGPNLGPQNGPGNLSGALQKFNGTGNLSGNFNAQQLQSLQQQAGNKNWQSRNGQFHENAQNAFNNFQNGPQPFTAQWYADHPNAWQYTHPHADAWAVATTTSVAAWLGWAAYPTTYGTSSTTIVYEQVPAEETTDEATTNDEILANQTATSQDTGDWLPLGVYSTASRSGEPTSRMLQLAVDHTGALRGVYYDAISNSTHNLTGQLDRATQQATWSLDSNPQVIFRTTLAALTNPSGTLEVAQPTGQQTWQLIRQENGG